MRSLFEDVAAEVSGNAVDMQTDVQKENTHKKNLQKLSIAWFGVKRLRWPRGASTLDVLCWSQVAAGGF